MADEKTLPPGQEGAACAQTTGRRRWLFAAFFFVFAALLAVKAWDAGDAFTGGIAALVFVYATLRGFGVVG